MSKHTKIWRIPKPNSALQEIFTLKLGISKVVAQILVNRGITTLEEAKTFLFGGTESLHDPFLMKDMEKAVERIRQAVDRGERIRIFGDYDVDGITSTSILIRVLDRLGANVDYYIPDRLTEGYGMNNEAVSAARKDGISLVITVDSGISSLDEVEFAKSLGMDVIITDHHEPPEILPRAMAVVNPKQKDCRYPFKDLAGAGVAFKLGQALTGESDAGLFEELTALVCLGTIADIVPLKGENRILVKQGLNSLARTRSVGVRALMEESGINCGEVNSRQVAFQMAPRINAAGRLGDANTAIKLLLSEDRQEALALAAELCALNEERQGIEAAIYQEALRIIQSGGVDLNREKVIVLAREGWHLGVIGIVASRLVQDFYRPVVLLGIDGNAAKGSARSIPSFNIYEAFRNNEKYLEKYGGHTQAAGLTMSPVHITAFREGLNRYADYFLTDEDLMPEIYIDSEVDFADLDEKLYRQLCILAPFGCENPGPLLASRKTSVLEYRPVGSDGSHLKMKVRDRQSVFDAIGFNLGERFEILAREELFDMVFALEKNEWNGRTSLQLNIRDFKPSAWADNPFTEDNLQEKAPNEVGFVEELFRNAVTYLTDDYYRDIADKEEFYTKVVGVTFENRQEIVAGLNEGEKLHLVREPDNPYDVNAVRVEKISGAQVGYLNARLARHFAPLLDRGEEYVTYVSQVTGGRDRNYGVNIVIQKVREESRAEYKQRMAKLREELACLPDDELREKIREAILGDNPYREKQLEALESLAQGFNTLAVFGTGRGKSAVFQATAAFKALRRGELTVILYPLRALVNDQYENMSARLERLGLRVYKGNGSISTMERAMLFDALENEGIDILLTTPEFVSHHLKKLQRQSKKIGLFVVDESHHIGMSSHTHRPIYKQLGELAGSLGSPTVLAVTATADDEVADEIIYTLGIGKVVIDSHVRANLQLVDKRDCPDKNGYLKKIAATGAKTIVYVNSRLQTVELSSMLREALPQMRDKIIFYHAGLSSQHRNTIEQMFRNGDVTTVISTSAFGEGIDIPDVKHIIVFHLNFNFTEFNQQCGRCGRDGETAQIHLVCGRRDAAINQFILEASCPDRDTLAKLYAVLKELSKESNPVTSSNDEIAKILRAAGVRYSRPNLVSAGVGILEELELIQREVIGRERQIVLVPAPGEKIELEQSVRYLEGLEEQRAFREFQDYFFKASDEELLSLINRPIYPKKYLDKRLPPHEGINCDIINN